MSDQIEKINEQLPTHNSQLIVCSVVSRLACEQLIGTASRSAVWFLLEYTSSMEGKAFEKSNLPDAVKDFLSHQSKSISDTRIQLIQQKTSIGTEGIHLFIAITSETLPALYEFHLKNYEDLLSIDISSLVADPTNGKSHLRNKPLILICTNGRRDPCCSRWGRPLYDEMSKYGNFIWQTSHVGGHRFAANVLWMPMGVYYGRVEKKDIESLIEACQTNHIYLPKYRGRSCYSPEVQAAEAFLRNETGDNQIDAFRFKSSELTSQNSWDILFNSKDGNTFRIQLLSKPSDFEVYESCKDQAPTVKNQFRLLQLTKVLGAADE